MNVLIIGATSGIGKALAKLYYEAGHHLILTGRQQILIDELSKDFTLNTKYCLLDVNDTESVRKKLGIMADKDITIDLAILCAGTGEINPELDFDKEYLTIRTNIIGWTCTVDTLLSIFTRQKKGHLAVITSVGGLRGEPMSPAYSASKAYQINYTEALRKKCLKSGIPINITDIRPGLVQTKMAKGEGLFWVMPVEKTARQIVNGINKNAKIRVVTHRWRAIHWLLRHLPTWIYDRI